MYCYTYKGRGIAALVEAMKIPVIEMRVSGQSIMAKLLRYRTDVDCVIQEVLIDMLFALFRINTPQWYQAFLGGKRLSSKLFILVRVFQRTG